MRKMMVIFIVFCLGCAGDPGVKVEPVQPSAQTEPSFYVSAAGADHNDGLSENTPFRTLMMALIMMQMPEEPIRKITVIGTLDINSEDVSHMSAIDRPEDAGVFIIAMAFGSDPIDILITGKPEASGADRAVLSGRGSGRDVVHIGSMEGFPSLSIRFEHIEISGGEGLIGRGIHVAGYNENGISVTLGPGAVIQRNGFGIVLEENAECIINGGEITDNIYGVYVDHDSTLTMSGGSISNNGASYSDCGGVFVNGNFNMTGGSITNNRASDGGGVVVLHDGTFSMSHGSITYNQAANGGGVFVNIGGRFTISGIPLSIPPRGGSVTHNEATNGGGVFVAPDGILTPLGGSITNNRAVNGGGVFMYPGSMQTLVRGGGTRVTNNIAERGDPDWGR